VAALQGATLTAGSFVRGAYPGFAPTVGGGLFKFSTSLLPGAAGGANGLPYTM